jgi:hypothetical protein
MQLLIIKHEDDCWFLDEDVQGKDMRALYDVLDAEGVSRTFDILKRYIIDLGQSGTGGNVIFVDIEGGMAKIELDPFVFGDDRDPFQTDEAQFKYMIKEFVRLKEKKVPVIMITRDEKGIICVREP